LELTLSGLLQSPTDPRQGWTGQLGGGGQARFTFTPNVELGFGGSYGRVFTLRGLHLSGPANVGTAYGRANFSEAQPAGADDNDTRGAGLFLTGGAAFGAGPTGQTGWFASAVGAYSWSSPNARLKGVDVNLGLGAAGYNQLNGVNVANTITPFASVNFSLPAHFNVELFSSFPVAAGGNLSDPTDRGIPFSFRPGFGVGYQIPLGDYGLGFEAGLTGELSNVRLNVPGLTGVPIGNAAPWLNISFGAVNRRPTTFGDTSAFPARY